MLQEFIYEDKVYRLRSQLDLDSPNEEPILFRDLNSAQAFFRSIAKNRLACEDLLEAAKWLGISNPAAFNNKISNTPQAVLELLCLKIWTGDILLVEIKSAHRTKTMTLNEKQQCAEVYEIYTGEQTPVDKWNTKAALLLAEMVHKIEECSLALSSVKAIWPSTSKVTWTWLVKIPYELIKNKSKVRNGYVNQTCLDRATATYKSSILNELIKYKD